MIMQTRHAESKSSTEQPRLHLDSKVVLLWLLTHVLPQGATSVCKYAMENCRCPNTVFSIGDSQEGH
jgi:hypothetical protein